MKVSKVQFAEIFPASLSKGISVETIGNCDFVDFVKQWSGFTFGPTA